MLLSEDYSNRLKTLSGINSKIINVYILIGPPAIGKSTYINSIGNGIDTIVINRDTIVSSVAKEYGLQYDDLFTLPPSGSQPNETIRGYEKFGKTVVSDPKIVRWAPLSFDVIKNINFKVEDVMNNLMQKSIHSKMAKNIIIDMTNMRKDHRKNLINQFKNAESGNRFKFIGVNFDISDPEISQILMKVAHKRTQEDLKKGIKKTFTPEIFDRMIKSYEPPSQEEGFDEIININTVESLKRFIGTN
jgi:hypothetical protein